MEFIRENLLKIVLFIGGLIIAIIIFSLIFGGKKPTKATDYSSMEQSMINATQRYVSKNKKLLPKDEDETSKVNLDTLVNFEYMKELSALEDENVKCTGYVEILYKNEDYMYVPYLKCGNYYETLSIADYIINKDEIVTTGDGLYQMNGKYVFRGENPNNFLGIGTRLYRIIDITEDGIVRLISYKRLNNYMLWDNRYNTEKNETCGINDYSKSRIKDYLNNLLKKPAKEEEIVFSSEELTKMVPQDICVGKRSSTYGEVSDKNECQKVEAEQKVALMTVSDYARASLDQNCKSIFDKSCMNYNYFSAQSNVFRTLTATSDNTYQVFYITDGKATLTRASSSFNTSVVIYIDNLSLYASGSGTFEDPYTIR